MNLIKTDTISVPDPSTGLGMIRDSGPMYHEFHPEAWIKEPWNAVSSLFFLVPVCYWLWRLRGQYRENMMITMLLPLLFLNAVGSTLFHAFRSSDFFMLLDGIPPAIMTLLLAIYMWHKVLHQWLKVAIVVLGIYLLGIAAMILLSPVLGDAAANVAYLITGSCVFIPILIFLVKTTFYKWQLITLTFLFLGGALLFRTLDYPTPNPFPDTLPQGTHFLWHISSAFAVFSLGYYFFYIKNIDLRKQNAD